MKTNQTIFRTENKNRKKTFRENAREDIPNLEDNIKEEAFHVSDTYDFSCLPIAKIDYKNIDRTIGTKVKRGIEYFHPLKTLSKINKHLYRYNATEDEIFLDAAKSIIQEMRKHCNLDSENIRIEYPFYFILHAKNKNNKETIPSGWISGMAQSYALLTFHHVYIYSENKIYKTIADGIFDTLKLGDSNEILCVENGYLYIEEYPSKSVSHVLNGFMSSILSLYTYWRLTQNDYIENLLHKCLTTLKYNIQQWRDPGNLSFYCMHKTHSYKYHHKHILQLLQIYGMTDENKFKEYALLFKKDHWNDKYDSQICKFL